MFDNTPFSNTQDGATLKKRAWKRKRTYPRSSRTASGASQARLGAAGSPDRRRGDLGGPRPREHKVVGIADGAGFAVGRNGTDSRAQSVDVMETASPTPLVSHPPPISGHRLADLMHRGRASRHLGGCRVTAARDGKETILSPRFATEPTASL